MDNKEFTEQIAAAKIGIWSNAAKIALETNDVDLFVQHWVRPAVERMLGKELTKFIQQQSIKGMNENKRK